MPTSPNLGITHVEQNQTNKEVTIDEAIDLLDQAMTDTVDIDVTSGNATVSADDYAENIRLKITGATTGGRTVTLPQSKRLILIVSDSGNTQSVSIVRGSTSISLAAGAMGFFYTDGTANGLQQTTVSSATGNPTESLVIAVGDETTAITSGTGKVTFRIPYAFTLSAVRASLTTAQASGSTFTVDINEGG